MTSRTRGARSKSILSDIARERRWFTLAATLQEAMAEPRRHGFSTADDVLAAAADSRGQHPGGLRGPIAARRFLLEHYPDFADERHIHCGFSQVQALAALHHISQKAADDIVADVLAGRLTTAELRRRYRSTTAGTTEEKSNARPQTSSKRRSVEFVRAVGTYVRAHSNEFCPSRSAEVLENAALGTITANFLLKVDEKPQAAVIVRLPGPSVYLRQINEVVGLSALLLQRVPVVWLITPSSARRQLERMKEVANEFDLKGMRFAAFDEARARKGSAGALQLLD